MIKHVSGFNNIRFDEKIIRRLLYRNLRDPYAGSGKAVTVGGIC